MIEVLRIKYQPNEMRANPLFDLALLFIYSVRRNIVLNGWKSSSSILMDNPSVDKFYLCILFAVCGNFDMMWHIFPPRLHQPPIGVTNATKKNGNYIATKSRKLCMSLVCWRRFIVALDNNRTRAIFANLVADVCQSAHCTNPTTAWISWFTQRRPCAVDHVHLMGTTCQSSY